MYAQRGVCGGVGSGSERRTESAGSGFVFSGWKLWRASETRERGSVWRKEGGGPCHSGAAGRAGGVSTRVDGDTGVAAGNVMASLFLAISSGGDTAQKRPTLQKPQGWATHFKGKETPAQRQRGPHPLTICR